MSDAPIKPYKGGGMEGFIATLYARQAEYDRDDLQATARRIAARLNAGSRVLEIAPGPGLLTIELARLTGGRVTGIDISHSFVQIAGDNARSAGVEVDFEHGDAADLPFPDDQFDTIVCRAAFKNFSRPLVALNEMHRVLKPGGTALIIDLRKDYSSRGVADYFKNRGFVAAAIIKLTFRFMLKGRAYTKDSMAELVSQSQFGNGEFRLDPIGFELTLRK
ncbi:MAG: methyltransferase domain-containing protein [Xanthobacteraceae bacterium]